VVPLSEVAHAEDAAVCADNLLQAVRVAYATEGQNLHVCASIGIAIYPGDGSEAVALLKSADSAMYEAKTRGRDNYQFYRRDFSR